MKISNELSSTMMSLAEMQHFLDFPVKPRKPEAFLEEKDIESTSISSFDDKSTDDALVSLLA